MGAWIEIMHQYSASATFMSHPTMGAWIEINSLDIRNRGVKVAPHDGCVD